MERRARALDTPFISKTNMKLRGCRPTAEHLLIGVLIAIAAVWVISLFSDNLQALFRMSDDAATIRR
jgi:hypothetical protein